MKKRFVLFFICLGTLASSNYFNDTLYTHQWGIYNNGQTIVKATSELNRLEIPGIPGVDIDWTNLTNYKIPEDREIVVAVVDSGLDVNHPDLQGRIWVNKEECPGELEAEVKEGKACFGYNALEGNGDLKDDTGHGTHVAGIIAANADNSQGIAGITDSRIKIMPIKVLSNQTRSFVYNGRLMTDIIADGIRFAIVNGADVINLSLGWPKIIEKEKIKKAIEIAIQKNIPVIAAAGNNNKNIITYPCSNRGVICVGAYSNRGKISEFSNFGGKVDILAPGDFIVSSYPVSSVESRILRIKGYETKRGTSQAAPMISAIAASLKLWKPEIDLGELKARLFSSAYSEEKSKESEKTSKFGRVSMKKAFGVLPQIFAAPDYKDILDIKYSKDTGFFFFNLPIDNYLDTVQDISIKIEIENVKLEDNIFTIPLLERGKTRNLAVKGSIIDQSLDNNTSLKVIVSKDGKIITSTETTIMFARDLAREKGITELKFENVLAKEGTVFGIFNKSSKLKRISDRFNKKKYPEFFIFDKGLQEDDSSNFKWVHKVQNSYIGETINLPKLENILAIFTLDLNFDGELDYFVYGMGKERKNLQFLYLNKEFKPLLGKHSNWKFPISEFEGLPLKNGFQEEFQWLKKDDSVLGQVLIPSFYKNYVMPDKDNSDDILDRIPENIIMGHLYYLNPVVSKNDVVVEYRVIDNFKFIENFRQKYRRSIGFNYNDPIVIENPKFQNEKSRDSGSIEAFISVGADFRKSYFQIEIASDAYNTVIPFQLGDYHLSGNGVYSVLDILTMGNPSSEQAHVAILDRDSIRIVRKDFDDPFRGTVLASENWGDPIVNYIAGFNNLKQTTFLESRYFVHAIDFSGKGYKLRINRDSVFPGVNFSETLSPIVLYNNGNQLPGVYINSTLIFGDRLYSMIKTENNFIRPIDLSITVPRTCVEMDPMRMGEKSIYHYVLLCRGSNNSLSMTVVPLN